MIYHAKMRFPKTKEASRNGKYFARNVVTDLIDNVNSTTGLYVTNIAEDDIEVVVTVEINTAEIDGPYFD